jgi:peroxiredoxin
VAPALSPTRQAVLAALILLASLLVPCAPALSQIVKQELIYQTGPLKPVDSALKVTVGMQAPDFDLPAIDGKRVKLSSYQGKKNVVLTFVPAAWTPVCSGQWPGYNLAKSVFDKYDAQLVGITCDNVPSLFAWVKEMGGVWFPVASDFWPHGAAAKKYGILRPEGVSERALFVVDKKGVIRYIDVHDINKRPDLGLLAAALEKLP